MAKARSLVGLDVHAAKVVAAVLDAETGELALFSMQMNVDEVAGFCAGLPGLVRAAYEAGPRGTVWRGRSVRVRWGARWRRRRRSRGGRGSA